MESTKKEEVEEDTINMENTTEEATEVKGATQVKAEDATQATTGPPTLDEMLADPIAFRRYVTVLADHTPQAPPDLYGDAFRNWESRQLLTATLSHLLAVFRDQDDPRQHAWWFYEAWLVVNNTDYKESPFVSFGSARSLFGREVDGRRKCARVAAGLPEMGKRGSGKRKTAVEDGGGGGKKRKSMLE
ncbi:hypothetical protein HO173_007647 [Letharia columbiana]|uniref:Uncharacterized protein n=1 Tax=Letharia columbiana TaxID=112416 RepID=A0A8H6L3J9_9LECA|nr:uncharacterized protein HO173_007647 [Letharia columbiana]KAF6234227.1 hypothetical protein HO173_007647 [Letharia columbiana]